MAGELTLADALERAESNNITDRTKGIADLRHVLRSNSKFDSLGDISFHRLYEVLFRVSVLEQSEYLKAKAPKTRSAAESRLSSCAGALRTAVEVGVRLIKLKTVRAVLDHISDTVLLPGRGFCEPLALDYAKSMRALLTYQPHVEHLALDDRQRIALFCVECIKNAQSELADDDAVSGAEVVSTTGTINGLSYRSSRSHFKESGGSQGGRGCAKPVAEEIVACLSLLTAPPNASCGNKASELLSALIGFLQSGNASGRSSHQEAFATINHVLAWTRTEDIGETRKHISKLLRLIKHYWSIKSLPTLKDEMLTTCLYIRPYLFSALQMEDDLALRSELSSVLDTIKAEYSRRFERDQLRIDDLRLDAKTPTNQPSNSIKTPVFSLRCTGARAEANWTVAYLLASFCNILSRPEKEAFSSDDEDDEINSRPRKRQRLSDEIDETLASSLTGPAASRICALQTLTFLAQQKNLSLKLLTKMVDKLLSNCSDDNATVSSWSMLALASCVTQTVSTSPSLSPKWISVFQLASRIMGNSSTCRTACYLLFLILKRGLVPQQNVAELMNAMKTSMNLNGPTLFADSTAHLLAYIVDTSQQLNPATSSATAESVLSWLLQNFTPSKFEDKAYASQHFLFEPRYAISLIGCCIGQVNHCADGAQFPIWEPVAQAWLACAEQEELLNYLLLLPTTQASSYPKMGATMNPSSSSIWRVSCEALVLNHFVAELYKAQEAWQQMIREKPRGISTDVFITLCNLLVVATCIAHCSPFRDSRRQDQLQRQVRDLLKAVSGFVTSPECAQEKADVMLIAFSPAFSGLSLRERETKCSVCEKVLCQYISESIASKWNNQYITVQDEDDDMMDMDETYDSQDSRRGNQSGSLYNLKNELAVNFSNLALRSNMTMYAFILSTPKHGNAPQNRDVATSTQVIDYVLSLPETFVLSSHHVLSRLSYLGIDLSADDTYRLLDYWSEKILPSYAYERSEVATGAILNVMSSLAIIWTNPLHEGLFGLGIDIYDWYTTTALSGGVLSPRVQKRAASLLLQLCHIDTDYGKDSDVASVRTSLFKLLQLGTISVQHHLATRISTIFGLFVLSKHSMMFNDLQQSLPAEVESTEGMAMRLMFFSTLGSAWHSLLRQCVYYIFETAGRVKKSAKHAAHSISQLATALNFQSPQKLFRLFAPQLLYTWLETHPVASLPFTVFQYESLHSLLAQNLSEVVAQLLVRGNDEGMEFVLSTLGISSRDAVSRSFAKCQAYCISWDLSRLSADSNETTSESRLRKLIGSREDYKTLVTGQFPVVMAQFYLSLQQDDVEDKWLEKRPNYKHAAKVLAEIKSFCHSDRALPESQQPSFRSKYLCDQIERLSRRTDDNPVNPWNPCSFSLAARILLESIDDALGPLHTCMVIRRLRLLISMAGDVAVSGFAVEMLIHGLRPFLNESQCADDAMGLLRYLFQRGEDYLRTNLSFLYGTTISIILQMRKHSGAKLDSTTQESQHKSTVQKMQAFHSWLVEFIQQCSPKNGDPIPYQLGRFPKALAGVNLPGNARKDSPESSLLLLLIEQVGTRDALLNNRDCNEALLVLSENFELPTSRVEDCLGDDADCVQFAPQLWNVSSIPKLDDAFLVWSAGVLGRAYASSGSRPLAKDNKTAECLQNMLNQFEGVARSQATIAARLSESLFSKDRFESSIADHTLRSVIMSFNHAEEAIDFEQMLPKAVVPAIQAGTYGHEPSELVANEIEDVPSLSIQQLLQPSDETTLETWAQKLSLALCCNATKIAILPALVPALQSRKSLAVEFFPCILHILLSSELNNTPFYRTQVSASLAAHLSDERDSLCSKQQYLIKVLLYLRARPLPNENTHADRLRWLEVDWLVAAQAAMMCDMPTAALLFAESASATSQSSRRASSRASMSQQITLSNLPQELLLSIFKAVEEPDSFYGVEQPASLNSVLDQLDYESDGLKSLMFRSAQSDTHLRNTHQIPQFDASGIVRSLSMLNLDSLTFALLSSGFSNEGSTDDMMQAALRLQQWDVVSSEQSSGEASSCFAAFQGLSRATESQNLLSQLNETILRHVKQVDLAGKADIPSHKWFGALASLTEISEVVCGSGVNAIREIWGRMKSRQSWMHMARYDDFRAILSNRQTLFGVLSQNKALATALNIGLRDSRCIEIESLLSVSQLTQKHDQLQEALTAASHVSNLVNETKDVVIKAEVAAKSETASALWNLGEVTSSVNMLRDALATPDFDRQDVPIGKSGLLAQLAHQLAEARLEKPDEILNEYLKPAITALKSRTQGEEAGKVFYEFATFCDKQLQNPDNLEDFNRITKLRQKKLDEVEELERISKTAKKSITDSKAFDKSMDTARKWFSIDDADYQRLKRSRDMFLVHSLQNYMQSLRASDEHDISILRFFALWLEDSDVAEANAIIDKHLPGVPSWKFVVLMNQLMSRLEQDNSPFQKSLRSLATRICADHPHHSLHHLFASTRKPSSKDDAAFSRYEVASGIRQKLQSELRRGQLLANIFRANNHYNVLAAQDMRDVKTRKVQVKDLQAAMRMAKAIPELRVPPPTISLALRPAGDYDDVPVVAKFGSTIDLMSGVSRPKKLTAYASNGQQFHQLFKSGDDLRQDAIMEQVFGEVSKMLRNHKNTRHRNLHVRTYKVIPLSSQSGIIEFVPNSTSLTAYLVPAHERYYPQDYKNDTARHKIVAAAKESTEGRIREFRKVCEHVHPVMRHFFFERFSDPDEWFEKRTAYTRTTAAISILGYVLGLGDRHCQNIMLDEKTGEVIHIDLGIAFEAGRVLPVPELVPFRLSRDVVDAMGITKTEGVFRRCCEFTMDALREDTVSIMTLLNVLRYDPLYTWTVSPIRAKRMQQETGRNANDAEVAEGSSKKREEEAGEADRALSIVEKKLSKTLSTAATVNELIQQATDEKNLATLFYGWSAWF